MMFASDVCFSGTQDLLDLSSSTYLSDVNYSCGTCGYKLNLNSCNRNAWVIGSKYGKSIKKGVISFFSIDESRFTLIHEHQFMPYFASKRLWGLFQPKTKLLCRKCGNYIGVAYKENKNSSPYPSRSDKPHSTPWDGISDHRTYDIKICALQPLALEQSGVFF